MESSPSECLSLCFKFFFLRMQLRWCIFKKDLTGSYTHTHTQSTTANSKPEPGARSSGWTSHALAGSWSRSGGPGVYPVLRQGMLALREPRHRLGHTSSPQDGNFYVLCISPANCRSRGKGVCPRQPWRCSQKDQSGDKATLLICVLCGHSADKNTPPRTELEHLHQLRSQALLPALTGSNVSPCS